DTGRAGKRLATSRVDCGHGDGRPRAGVGRARGRRPRTRAGARDRGRRRGGGARRAPSGPEGFGTARCLTPVTLRAEDPLLWATRYRGQAPTVPVPDARRLPGRAAAASRRPGAAAARA